MWTGKYPDRAQRPSAGWKVLQSWWILISIIGFGCLSGAGFVLIGLRARKPWWWGSGLAYLLAGSGLFVLYGRDGNSDTLDGNLALLWFSVWLICVTHSLILNVFWLRWQEARWTPSPVPAYGPPPTAYVPHQPYPVFGPIDVNTASPEQFGTLADFDPARIAYVLAERNRRRGFGSVEEFAAAAYLAPHQFARLRPQLICTPRTPWG